jgi:hypothetical protein
LRDALMMLVVAALGCSSDAFAQRRMSADPSGVDFRIVVDDERFGPDLRRPVRVVDGRTGEVLDASFRCRWVPAHSDIGLASDSPDGCVAEVYVDPARTRRSRFELDPVMGLDVIVRRGNERVGFASTRLRFVE